MSWVNYNCYVLEPAIAYYSRKCVPLHHLLPCLLANRINAFLRHMQRFGYLQCRITVAELMNKSDHDLFCKLCTLTHALNHLLPPTSNRASLRTRGHLYQLPEYSTDLRKKSFLIRSLYSFVKWNSFFGFAALYCTSFWLFFVFVFFDVRLSHLINITCIHTYIHTYLHVAEPPESPHNVSVARVTSSSVTLRVTSLALANRPPTTSWRVNYSTAEQHARQLASVFAADRKCHVL